MSGWYLMIAAGAQAMALAGPTRPYPAKTLGEFAQYVGETRQPGYGNRLRATSPGYIPGAQGAPARVPPGCDAVGHPNRHRAAAAEADPEFLTSVGNQPVQAAAGLQAYFRSRGWVLDQHGRPLHPHHVQLLADERIGLPTGLGFAWWLGETAVVDAVVTAVGAVLLTTRDTDRGRIPCLTGGYAIPADEGRTPAQWRAGDRTVTTRGIFTTAARKVGDETGLRVPVDARMRIVRAVRPISSPHTLNAWTCTFTVHVDLGRSERPALPDSVGDRWVGVDELHEDVLHWLWPDHRRGLLAALA
ncbi:hypothetical protein H4696_003403 [Amycolatopsis lexingtonensis]|uniref:Nudix hydrolase domain-containing protein n=1 Tax=Amycolatopsis lexingtonensis TaxID=218822 RepID=A0ABR9HZD1_9PSEU|nr:NUDIX hydrolase [Amycolatopsis lexingtonensis]MBE1496303.1 hypothetical protein [Amycolatopsis lexingtonensis]